MGFIIGFALGVAVGIIWPKRAKIIETIKSKLAG